LRSYVTAFSPEKYLGVDIVSGMEVDIICSGENLLSTFGLNSFDIVIASELMEHVLDWKSVISNIKNVCKPLGFIFLTTRSPGFPYHPCPIDTWRYTLPDFEFIFNDFTIIDLCPDPQAIGVFIFAQKPLIFSEIDLDSYSVYKVKHG